MRSFLYLAALACVQGQSPTSSVSAPAVAVVGTQGPAGVQQTLLKNLPTFSVLPNAPNSFDVCATCLANPLDPSSLVPTCVPQQSRVSLECVSGGLNSVHVVLDSQLLIQLTFNQLSQASVLILVKATESLSNAVSHVALPDFHDEKNPISGPFNPRDRRSPYIFVTHVPSNLTLYTTSYSLVYRAYGVDNTTRYREFFIRNLTLDANKDTWILAPNPTGQTSTPFNTTTSPIPVANTDTGIPVWPFILLGAIIAALIIIVTGVFWMRKHRKRFPDAPSNQFTEMESRISFNNLVPVSLLTNRSVEDAHMASVNSRATLAEDDGAHSDDELVVFKRDLASLKGGYSDRGSVISKGASSGVSMQSILKKTTKMVQSEALQASMYDTVLSEHQKVQMAAVDAAASAADVVNVGAEGETAVAAAAGSTKRVMFRETVDTAVVDLSLPPSNDAVMDSLFDDDYDIVEEDYLPHFDDGGIERDVKAIMRRSVELVMEENEEEGVQIEGAKPDDDEYDSETEDNDDWREGE